MIRHGWHPDGKFVCGLGPRSEGPWPGIGMPVMAAVAQVEAKSKTFCLKSAPMGQPLLKPPHSAVCEHLPISPEERGAAPSCVMSELSLSSGRQTPGWERMCSGSLQGPCSPTNKLLFWRTSARSFYISASSLLQIWSKLLSNCRSVGVCKESIRTSQLRQCNLLRCGNLVIFNCWYLSWRYLTFRGLTAF